MSTGVKRKPQLRAQKAEDNEEEAIPNASPKKSTKKTTAAGSSPTKKKPLFYAGSRPQTKDSISSSVPPISHKNSREGTAASKR